MKKIKRIALGGKPMKVYTIIQIKIKQPYHSGEKVELKHVVLDSGVFIGTWQRKDEKGIC
ncbi:hypothetical protein J22TS1_27840 [Siminovitchia terrae]|nr:hypothetical protein J22TS1_27840 [Siminovitchia terrae]